MTARLLEQRLDRSSRVRVFEAGDRLGGKLQTRRFDSAAVRYEAGIAECYDYHHVGHDPLRAFVEGLGLQPIQTSGTTVVLNSQWLRDDRDIERLCGRRTREALERFRREAMAMLPPGRWCQSGTTDDVVRPWARQTWADLLTRIPDPVARRYVEVASHSDLATEPHLTGGLVGLRTFLRSVPAYAAQYTIRGGMERLSEHLAESLNRTQILLRSPVVSVAGDRGARYRLGYRRGSSIQAEDFDAVVVALPYGQLRRIAWAGHRLRRAMNAHIARFDRPGHYLRVSMLFERAFWRPPFHDSFLMLDAFGGCCLYDESPPGDDRGYGVLGWLLAGASASTLARVADDQLRDRVIEALPRPWRPEARQLAVEVKVNRWVGALSGVPGGMGVKPRRASHQPEPVEHPGLVVVGDYLFDSTLNGVLRSARLAADLIAHGSEAQRHRTAAARWCMSQASAHAPTG